MGPDPLRVHIHDHDSESDVFLESLRSQPLDPRVEWQYGEIPDPAGYDILVAGRPPVELLEASPRLRALIIPFAGIPPATRERLASYPALAVHNLHHNAVTTAEFAVSLMLAAGKRILPLDSALRRNDWTPRYDTPPSLFFGGRTALILGYGAIGRALSPILGAFGMTVLALRRTADPTAKDHPVYGMEDLPRLIPRAQVLFITLPFTEETRGLLGATELARLPAASILVNVARAGIVDEEVLYEALKRGAPLAAAGLDVWYHYPEDRAARANTAPSSYPFHELDNVVMSPHRAGTTDASEQLRAQHLARLLNAAAAGEPIPNRVSLTRGY